MEAQADNASEADPGAAATSESSSSSSSSGLWGLWNAVKRGTETIVQVYKEDLAEFGTTITEDTVEVVDAVSQRAKEVTSDVHRRAVAGSTGAASPQVVVTNIKRMLWDGDDDEAAATKPPPTAIMTPKERRIWELQDNVATYCTEPTDLEAFTAWLEGFDIQEQTTTISHLLHSETPVRRHHDKFVPMVVSYNDFWQRYFFALHALERQEAERADLIKRATSALGSSDDDDLSWDLEGEGDAMDNATLQTDTTTATPATATTAITTTTITTEGNASSSAAEPATPPRAGIATPLAVESPLLADLDAEDGDREADDWADWE